MENDNKQLAGMKSAYKQKILGVKVGDLFKS